MKVCLYMFVFLLLSITVDAQKILLVDDSKDNFENTLTLSTALTQIGKDHDLFDAVDQQQTPDLVGLLEYDIVIWHTSTDGAGLQLWNGSDEDNAIIKSYLESGKILWLIGNDFLFDRYETGEIFSDGSFAYDYLGIGRYDVQSYYDDDFVGMPVATVADMNPIDGLNDITWQFSTLWNADGVSLADDAVSIYDMGSSAEYPNYVLEGRHTATLYQSTGTALTYFFDLSLAANADMIAENMATVLEYLEGFIVNTDQLTVPTNSFSMFPNPAYESIHLSVDFDEAVQVSIYTTLGNMVREGYFSRSQDIDISDLKPGTYVIELHASKLHETRSFTKI